MPKSDPPQPTKIKHKKIPKTNQTVSRANGYILKKKKISCAKNES